MILNKWEQLVDSVHDPYHWMIRHHWLTRPIAVVARRLAPVMEFLDDIERNIAHHEKCQAMRDVGIHGDDDIEVRYWKEDRSAAEIYEDERNHGWEGQPRKWWKEDKLRRSRARAARLHRNRP